ncbi:MAG TPA: hypothetical protein VIV60_21405, partial [Polyangiaceae bacterium]
MPVAQGSCPACGAAIEFGLGASIAKVCEDCRSTVLRTDRGLQDLGKVAALADTPSLIAVGDQGILAGRPFEVLGRVQLDPGSGPWDEYYVAFDHGQSWGWLAYAQGRWHVTQLVEACAVPKHADLQLEADVPLGARGAFRIIVEVTKIKEDGSLVFSSSCGANTAYFDVAEKYILEVNEWQDERLEGMHDIFGVTGKHGERTPIPVLRADDRVGSTTLKIDISKVAAVVVTNNPDRNAPFKAPEADHKRIAQHILDFLDGEVKAGRLPKSLTPLQSGVGNIANAVLVGLNEGHFENMTSYTEVIQDGMLDLLDS